MIKFKYSTFFSLLVLSTSIMSEEKPDQWYFKVSLDDKPVGFHQFTITEEGNQKNLKSEARFDVDFFVFNAYSYRHQSNEYWNGDCLSKIDASTDDNGEKITVKGQSKLQNFQLDTNKGQKDLPACIMTFAYWNPKMLDQRQLLNPQDGEFLSVDIQQIGKDKIKIKGRDTLASHYRLKSEKFLIELWYADNQRWVGLDSVLENGRVLHYRIE